jgi:hypothetical protein
MLLHSVGEQMILVRADNSFMACRLQTLKESINCIVHYILIYDAAVRGRSKKTTRKSTWLL